MKLLCFLNFTLILANIGMHMLTGTKLAPALTDPSGQKGMDAKKKVKIGCVSYLSLPLSSL